MRGRAGNRHRLRSWRGGLAALVKRDLISQGLALGLTLALMLVLTLSLRQAALPSDSQTDDRAAGLAISASLVDDDQSFVGRAMVEFFGGISYITAIYQDTMDKALERLEDDQVMAVLRLPPNLFAEARTGSQIEPIQLWLNPRMPAEAGQIGILVRQYAAAFNYLYGAIFGYQKLYVDLGGEEGQSWEKATSHSLNVLIMYFSRTGFADEGDYLPFTPVTHALSGILLIFSLLPAMGVLSATVRTAGTSYEDRLLMTSGYGPLMLSRLISGALWWTLLVIPLLYLLKMAGAMAGLLPAAAVLFLAYLSFALLMLALGRVRAPDITLLLAGWFVFFIFLVLGGTLYPIALFPVWLNKLAVYTPLYGVMQPVYRAIIFDQSLTASQVALSAWPLPPALILAMTLGRRRL
ncbi:MAG: ABC transporter permease [Clostridiaceae bacterium]|nr:ABC transporter permease [Clostridiaceae bacterium]